MMNNGEHLPLSISRLTPNRIETATDKAISIAWQDSRDENPYGQAEEFAAFIVRAVNSHEALVAVLTEVREQCLFDDDDGVGVSEDVVIPSELFDRICAAIKAAEASA